jgi:hypothetical protein
VSDIKVFEYVAARVKVDPELLLGNKKIFEHHYHTTKFEITPKLFSEAIKLRKTDLVEFMVDKVCGPVHIRRNNLSIEMLERINRNEAIQLTVSPHCFADEEKILYCFEHIAADKLRVKEDIFDAMAFDGKAKVLGYLWDKGYRPYHEFSASSNVRCLEFMMERGVNIDLVKCQYEYKLTSKVKEYAKKMGLELPDESQDESVADSSDESVFSWDLGSSDAY